MQAPPRGPPRGGAGDGSAAIVNGWVYAADMRTQALRVSVGAYSDGSWHVAQIIDYYERGVLVNSAIESLHHADSWGAVRAEVDRALERLRELELQRTGPEAGGFTQADGPLASGRR